MMQQAPPSYPAPRSKSRKAGPSLIHFYEVWENASDKLKVREGILPPGKVEEWLRLEGDYRIGLDGADASDHNMILRIVACDFEEHPFALGCGHATFETIRKAFALHETSEEAILNNNGAFGRYFIRSPISLEVESFALVLKVANCVNIGYDSISLSYSPNSRTTRAFIHGLLDEETERLFQELRTINYRPSYEVPLLLPTCIYQSYRAKSEAHRISVDDNLVRTEINIGYAIPGLHRPRSNRYFPEVTSKTDETLEFDTITRRLHSCATELCAITHAGNTGKSLGSFLLQTAAELEELLPKLREVIGCQPLVHRIEFNLNMFTTLLSQSSALKERVQSQVNLTFSLMAQDENRISRLVAEESAMIAVATKRDSSAMKTIAFLTTVFLPPTFVATFFSMTMFNWTPEEQSSRVTSGYLWVYWVVALPLTALVLSLWRLWLRKEDKSYREDLDRAKQERSKGPKFSQHEVITSGKLMAEYVQAPVQLYNRRASVAASV